jgi:hypothetical protein
MKRKKTIKSSGFDRREFVKISSAMSAIPFVGAGPFFLQSLINESEIKENIKIPMKTKEKKLTKAYADLIQFPFLNALFGRRARRFGLGMKLPSGPLAFKSSKEPLPLSETEQMLLVAAATGVSGWNFGVPFGPNTPDSHAEFTVRFTGRTTPTAAGIGTPALFFTDDFGCYSTLTRDIQPGKLLEFEHAEDSLKHIISVCRDNTVRIQDNRLDLPSSPPHILPPNLWWANKPGSTLFFPMADAAEICLGIMALMLRHGVMVEDHETGKPAGNLEPFVKSGLLNPQKRLPIAELLSDVHQCACLETAFMGHNIVLMLQAIGLGGLYFNGMDDLSIQGAYSKSGVNGLGFRFVEDERWLTPNPVGLDGVYEALCPPFYPDMHAAVKVFVDRKFGKNGAYNPDSPGPWKESEKIKKSVKPYSNDFVDCLSEVSQYMYDKFGKFPGIRSTVVLPGYVQAHHIDIDFYDKYYKEGAYLQSHGDHLEHWHK